MKSLIRLLTVGILSVGIFTIVAFKGADLAPLSLEKQIAQHVVSFNMMSRGNQRFATGFHLKYNGEVYIVTNKHVCDLHKRVYNHKYIQFQDYVGEIIAIDDLHDLCLVTSNRKDGLSLASEEAQPMDELILIGHPRGIGKTVRKGHYISMESITAPWIGYGKHDAIQISCQAYGGNSGSPVTNNKGEVVGVLFAGSPMYPGEPLMVPLSYLELFLNNHAI